MTASKLQPLVTLCVISVFRRNTGVVCVEDKNFLFFSYKYAAPAHMCRSFIKPHYLQI